jgi:uncharacterized repeat protein (TIGR03803 family)
MIRLRSCLTACGIFLFAIAATISSPAQTFITLLTFDGTDGSGPSGSLVQGTDGNLYGTTQSANPAHNGGIVFKITAGGVLTMLHSEDPSCAALVLATDGNFYGTTRLGGANAYGSIFKITPEGAQTTLHSFDLTDGAYPCASLVQGNDGNFYGTTEEGGAHDTCQPDPSGVEGCGTVFKITPAGVLTTLHNFDLKDGGNSTAELVQGTDGNFYGSTPSGGVGANSSNGYGLGTLFKITPGGTFTTLHSFALGEGHYPHTGLIQAADGNLYGVTAEGGDKGSFGTVFKITLGGQLTTLHSFDFTDGFDPYGTLVQATDGNFYGTVLAGGDTCPQSQIGGCGTIFKISSVGTLTTLHNFQAFANGFNPYAGLVQATDGNFYGTTTFGGVENCNGGLGCGTLFRLSTGIPPFVSFIRDSGKVGATVQILGQGFTGTTSVTFNGTPAKFTVNSDTYLTATVPAGASWGFVTVTTPSGVLKSNVRFRVTPQIFSNTPTSGPAGTTVIIQGMSFHRTYAITFGNIRATDYTVDSDTQITVTVPTGAEKGKIAVLTPGGTAYSPTCFDVIE